MLRTKSASVDRHRFSSLLLILLSCALLGSTLSTAATGTPVYVEMTGWHVLQGDILVTYISPVVKRLSVDTFSSTPDLDFRVSFSLNESDLSVVRMQPLSAGLYNLTVIFETERAWNYTLGVLTSKPGFYSEYADILDTGRGSLVRFYTRTIVASSGNSTLILMLNSHDDNPHPAPPGSPFVLFNLPESLILVVFIAVTVVLGYTNAFLMADSYFRSKKDVLSRGRWVLIILLLAVTVLVIYQLYCFAAI